jgi:predicted amidohydrolase YtcJ
MHIKAAEWRSDLVHQLASSFRKQAHAICKFCLSAPCADPRNRIEHSEGPDTEDIPRFGKLGVIASVQPLMIYPRDE